LNLNELLAPVADDMKSVDAVIRAHLDSEVVLIRTIGEHIIGGGGKRMRPALVLMVARALGYQGELHHLLAAAIEFIHTSTLLHDDVVDESSLRRGRATANAAFGNAASVLVGDYLYARAFEMMVKAGSMDIMGIMSRATTLIAEGEVLQLLNVHDPDISRARYLDVVRLKTAMLFEAAAEVGAVLAGASTEKRRQAAAYGLHLGMAFQLIDDVLDYVGDAETLGKNVGDDLREGKPTLPLIRVLEEAALDLGASPVQVFFRITLPLIAPALGAAWLLSFTLSLDDVVVASFLSGPGYTPLSPEVFARVRLGLKPEVNALATLFIVVVGACVIVAHRLQKRSLK